MAANTDPEIEAVMAALEGHAAKAKTSEARHNAVALEVRRTLGLVVEVRRDWG